MKADRESIPYEVDSELVSHIQLTVVGDIISRNAVCALRYAGYRGLFRSPADAWDQWDEQEHARVLLLSDKFGAPVGTVRLMDSSRGPIELSDFRTGFRSNFPGGTTFIEGARLVATRNSTIPRQSVQAAIWKATFLYGEAIAADVIVVWSKRGPDRGYQYLCFSETPNSDFTHPRLGGKHHKVFTMSIQRAKEILRAKNHPLTGFFSRITTPIFTGSGPSSGSR